MKKTLDFGTPFAYFFRGVCITKKATVLSGMLYLFKKATIDPFFCKLAQTDTEATTVVGSSMLKLIDP